MHTHAKLPTRDRVIIGLLIFFLIIAFSLELYWIIFRYELVARADHEWMAYLFKIYGDADRAYYDQVTPFSSSLEIINVAITQWLNVWLIIAIVKRHYYRYALQLTVGSYLAYSVVLYFWVAHIDGYAAMRYQSFYTYFMFYVPNFPWLFGYAYMAYDAIVAICRRFAPSYDRS